MNTIEMENTARVYREIQAMIRELEAEAETLKQDMIREMDEGNMTEFAAGEYIIRWNLYESNRLDTTKLKTEHPDLYAAYTKKTVSTRFQVA